mmetsp:Transcript_41992/g.68174  ORF Transcript_41992/g.68174 Transcript_41992/m.68174 type:complete len:868 (-) Transcript_41992:281-2884(-)
MASNSEREKTRQALTRHSIEDLLDCFVKCQNARRSKPMRSVQDACNRLFSRDYVIKTINNTDGSFCSSYPLDLIILQKQKDAPSTIPTLNQTQDLRERFLRGRFARVRGRFPIPVILWNNKNICRSSTISVQAEVLLNVSRDRLRDIRKKIFTGKERSEKDKDDISYTVEAQRKYDTDILENLQVKYICDLMVEKHKMKMGVVVCSSSEKAEGKLYESFHIQPMPYPGCEFFRDFKENKHCGRDLRFNWDCGYIDAKLVTPLSKQLDLDWSQYKKWDIVVLTQNYFRLILEYINDRSNSSGLLVHCISGWDRTPLFISLLRLSLWADGEIHQSLSANEILFLTLGYDWMLFSHLLDDRLAKGEDIFYFCFYMLPFISKQEFSMIQGPRNHSEKDSRRKKMSESNKTDDRQRISEVTHKVKSELEDVDERCSKIIRKEEFNDFSKITERKTSANSLGLNLQEPAKLYSFEKKRETIVQKGFSISKNLEEEEEFMLKGDLCKGSVSGEPKANTSAPKACDIAEGGSNGVDTKSSPLFESGLHSDLKRGAAATVAAEGGNIMNGGIERGGSGSNLIAQSALDNNGHGSTSYTEDNCGSASEEKTPLHSTSKSINIDSRISSSVSRGRSEHADHKVAVGSWQMVSAELHSNSPSLSENNPVFGLRATPPRLTPPRLKATPPMLRKVGVIEKAKYAGDCDDLKNSLDANSLEDNTPEDPTPAFIHGSFNAKMSPSFAGVVERASKHEDNTPCEKVTEKGGVSSNHQRKLKSRSAGKEEGRPAPQDRASSQNVEEDDGNTTDNIQRCAAEGQKTFDAAGVKIEDAEKLRRRAERLNRVHDLFMHAYRERILGDTAKSLTQEGGMWRWLPIYSR